mmetsp:Transcript_245/g.370  ORF Transcript_245/g.370 Transcript_245/m.370 type:complete len:468 (+) Transcript_245:65-1468(+)
MSLKLNNLDDSLVRSITNDLKSLHRLEEEPPSCSKEYLDEKQSLREALAAFAASHPQAERIVARLLLKHAGFSTSIMRESLSESNYRARNSKIWNDNMLVPALSPVRWLSDSSWSAMTRREKSEFMQCACRQPQSSDVLTPSVFVEASNAQHSDRIILGYGPRRVLIIVGVHGNEPCGVLAVRQILEKFCLFRGSAEATSKDFDRDECWDDSPLSHLFEHLTIEFVLGNPKAYYSSKRFMRKNLNRLLDPHLLCDEEKAVREGYEYELQRARILNESIRHSDFVLDVHSCSADTGSFALPSSMELSEDFAELLPVNYVVQSLAHMTIEGGTTLDAALLHNVPGICVECGKHDHPDVVARAAAVISSCLRLQLETVEVQEEHKDAHDGKVPPSPVVMKCVTSERVHEGFEWLQEFPEFHFVPFDAEIFQDKVRGKVCCPYEPGAYIVMPTAMPVLGEEALFWAVGVDI